MSTSWWWEEQPQREVEKKVLRDKLLSWKKKKVQGCVSQNSAPTNSIIRKARELGLNASAGHTWNFQDASGTTWIRERRAIRRHHPKRRPSWRARCWGTTTWGNLMTSRLYQQSSMEFGDKICKLNPNMKQRFILLWRRQRHRRSYVYCVFGSFSAQCWARRIEHTYDGYFEKVQNPICDLPRLGTVQINE